MGMAEKYEVRSCTRLCQLFPGLSFTEFHRIAYNKASITWKTKQRRKVALNEDGDDENAETDIQ